MASSEPAGDKCGYRSVKRKKGNEEEEKKN
jgi:hypothetical protein